MLYCRPRSELLSNQNLPSLADLLKHPQSGLLGQPIAKHGCDPLDENRPSEHYVECDQTNPRVCILPSDRSSSAWISAPRTSTRQSPAFCRMTSSTSGSTSSGRLLRPSDRTEHCKTFPIYSPPEAHAKGSGTGATCEEMVNPCLEPRTMAGSR